MRLILLALFLLPNLYAVDTKVVRSIVNSIEKDTIVFNAYDLQVGESGVVLTKNENHEIIIARADIQQIHNGNAIASIEPFESIAQKYLPTPINKPQVGDEVLFRSFYNRAIVIAPNQESYQYIIRNNPHIHFMHIDLFAAYLQQKNINDPKPKNFQDFCPKYSIGLVFLIDSQETKILDCQSFSLLQTQNLPPQDMLQVQSLTPFFSRISKPDKPLGSKIKSHKSKDYFLYYDSFLYQ